MSQGVCAVLCEIPCTHSPGTWSVLKELFGLVRKVLMNGSRRCIQPPRHATRKRCAPTVALSIVTNLELQPPDLPCWFRAR